MKKVTYTIILLMMLSACKKENAPQTTNLSSKYLTFETKLINTKGVAKTDFVIGDQFFIYGITTQSEDFNPQAPNSNGYIFTQEVAKGVPIMNYGVDNKGQDIWKYNNPVVWSPGKSTFFAFSPVPNHTQNFGITNYNTGFDLTKIPHIDFQVAGGYDPLVATPEQIIASRALTRNQVDLLVAYTPDQTAGKLVNLLFEHALARVNFAVKPMHKTGFLRINSVTIQNVLTACKLNLAHAQDPNAIDYAGGWDQTSLKEPRSFSINLRHDVVSLIPASVDKVYSINDTDETLMMIPQSLTNINLVINYAYSVDGVNWPDYQNGKELTVQLSKISSHWKQAKQYRYILALAPDGGSGFDVGIVDMEPEHDVPVPGPIK